MLFDGPPPAAFNQIGSIRDQIRRQEMADEQDTDTTIRAPDEPNFLQDAGAGESSYPDRQQQEEEEEQDQNPSTIPDKEEQEQNWQYQYPAQWTYGLDQSLEWERIGITYADSSHPDSPFEDDAEASVKQALTLVIQPYRFILYLFQSKISRSRKTYERLISRLSANSRRTTN